MQPNWINFKELRAKLNFEQVLRHYGVEIKARGQQHHGFCPLPSHQGEKRSASFSANLAKGIWQCFGCGAKGNVIDFAVFMERLDPEKGENVRTAALLLQERFCPELAQTRRDKPPAVKPSEPKAKEPSAMPALPVVANAPLDFALKQLDPEHPYLASRGLSRETVGHFGLGFCAKGMLAGRIAIGAETAEDCGERAFPGKGIRGRVSRDVFHKLFRFIYRWHYPTQTIVVKTIVCVFRHAAAGIIGRMGAQDLSAAFGVVLKRHREKKGISQEALAEKAGVHPTHISLIERFERNPSLNVAKSLASALGVSLADLIREAERIQSEAPAVRGK